MEKLNYFEAEKEVIDSISKNKLMVLATSFENRVTARTMSIINKGITIFFQTDKNFIKYQQIERNPNVALCIENIQIEGIAKIKGHPYENSFFTDTFKIKHKGSYENYSHLTDEIVIEVEPHFITFWKYNETDRKPYRDFINVRERKAYREYYLKTI
ncbi:MAG TPA: pyridoxamine 5'-phosphate oxidase [Firmicutes bacterium]|jgi:general stress protein 26|nr:pyridoxamine 5'-phosphate oxidase [Bacillota bacterium]